MNIKKIRCSILCLCFLLFGLAKTSPIAFSDYIDKSDFNTFKEIIKSGGKVKAIVCPNANNYIRKVIDELTDLNILAGIPVSRFYPEHPHLSNLMLVTATEMNTKSHLDSFIDALNKVL